MVMKVAVIGARGAVGRACVQELLHCGHTAVELSRTDKVPKTIESVIVAAPVNTIDFYVPIVDCSGSVQNTSLSLPGILESESRKKRIPNCMASLIAQALAPLHFHCTITSIIATCMQSASGAGWRGVQALEQNTTEEMFGGQLEYNVLPHEKAEQEELEICNDLSELFGCRVVATSFRVPVFVGHIASLQIETRTHLEESFLPCAKNFDPRTMENQRTVAIGRVRAQKKTADLVVCGDQLLCGTAIPAIASIIRT